MHARAVGGQRREERERQAEARPASRNSGRFAPYQETMESKPRSSSIRRGGRLGDAQQIEAGGGDGAHAVGETHQRNVRRRVQTSRYSAVRHSSAGSETMKSPIAPGRMISLRTLLQYRKTEVAACVLSTRDSHVQIAVTH